MLVYKTNNLMQTIILLLSKLKNFKKILGKIANFFLLSMILIGMLLIDMIFTNE